MRIFRIFDEATKKWLGITNPAKPTIVDFDVSAEGGLTQFDLGTAISDDDYIEVVHDGREKFEGASRDWERDSINNRIDTNETIRQYSHLRVKIFKV